MRPTLTVLIAALLALAGAGPAAAAPRAEGAAQARAGEAGGDKAARAVARRFADAALRAEPELTAAAEGLAAIGSPPACELDVAPERRGHVRRLVAKLHTAQTIAAFTRASLPALTRASRELHAIKTSDRALRGGRSAWRTIRATYAEFAALPAWDVCRQVAAYVAGGYEPTPAVRRGAQAYRRMMAWDTRGIDRLMRKAVKRLVALGVPADEADAFLGGL